MHNIAIPFVTLLVAVAGHRMTRANLDWYKTIKKPSWTPSGSVIGIVWTGIYVLATVSALMVWNMYAEKATISISMFYIANAALNMAWSYIFFVRRDFGAAVLEMCVLNMTTIMLIYLILPLSTAAALLLLPYFLWVTFATYLAARIWRMNAVR